jgi:signal transduction histidine kinase
MSAQSVRRGSWGVVAVAAVVVVTEIVALSPLAFVVGPDVPPGIRGAAGLAVPIIAAVIIGPVTGAVAALAGAAFLVTTMPGPVARSDWAAVAVWPPLAGLVGLAVVLRRRRGDAERTSELERLATEAHDETVQVLAAAVISLDRLRNRIVFPGDPRLTFSIDLVREGLEGTRRLVFRLRSQESFASGRETGSGSTESGTLPSRHVSS